MSPDEELVTLGLGLLRNEINSKCPLMHRFGYRHELFLLLCARDLVRTKLAINLPSSFDQLFNVLGPDRSILLKYIHRTESGHESLYTCSMCGKSNAQKNNMMIHVESVHFPGMFVYSCKYCPKQLSTKKALYGHVNNYHK